MDQMNAIEVLRRHFAHVEVVWIIVEFDPILKSNVAKVCVKEAQLAAARGENGRYAKLAAMNSGLDVEVVTAK